jgi:acyl-CoA hydrolase
MTQHDEPLRIVEIVFPTDTNSQGSLFGGHALSLMDRLAFIVASRHARKPVVTVSTDKVEFLAPVKVGNLIELIGHISRVGRTSITVDIEMYAEDLLSGERHLCTTGRTVMVAVDANGRPTPVVGEGTTGPAEPKRSASANRPG